MVTAGTYLKKPHFASRSRLGFLCNSLIQLAQIYEWKLQAWAVFPNHYHVVAISPRKPDSLRKLVRHLHSVTAIQVNRLDGTPGRRVWFEFWDSEITSQRSYFARLSYVHHNAVHHGLVRVPAQYPWCSAGWFEGTAEPSFRKTVVEFPHSRTKIADDFTVDPDSIA